MTDARDSADSGDDDLIYGGVCPVCDEEFVDGMDEFKEGESYNARVCIVEKPTEGEEGGSMLVHRQEKSDAAGEEEPDCLYCLDEGTVKRRYGTVGPGPAKIVKRIDCPMCGDGQKEQ